MIQAKLSKIMTITYIIIPKKKSNTYIIVNKISNYVVATSTFNINKTNTYIIVNKISDYIVAKLTV